MAGPTTTLLPLIKRIEGILSAGEGAGRVLAEGNRFGLGVYPEQDRMKVSVETFIKKRCSVRVTGARRLFPGEKHPEKQMLHAIEVHFFYWLEGADRHESMRALLAEIADDMTVRVPAALCFPGNVDVDSTGAATGVAGATLTFVEWSLGAVELAEDENGMPTGQAAASATMALTAHVTIQQPSP